LRSPTPIAVSGEEDRRFSEQIALHAQRTVLRPQSTQLLTLARGQPVVPSTGVKVALAQPVAQGLVRDAQIAAQAADRLGPGTN